MDNNECYVTAVSFLRNSKERREEQAVRNTEQHERKGVLNGGDKAGVNVAGDEGVICAGGDCAPGLCACSRQRRRDCSDHVSEAAQP